MPFVLNSENMKTKHLWKYVLKNDLLFLYMEVHIFMIMPNKISVPS